MFTFFHQKISLKNHIKSIKERKFHCVICDSHFSKERHLYEHYEQVHESQKQREEKTLHCSNPKCDAKFHNRLSLIKHKRHYISDPPVHEGKKNSKEAMIKCLAPKCDAKFKDRASFCRLKKLCIGGSSFHEGKKHCNKCSGCGEPLNSTFALSSYTRHCDPPTVHEEKKDSFGKKRHMRQTRDFFVKEKLKKLS